MKTLESGLAGLLLAILVLVALAQSLRLWIVPLVLCLVTVAAARSFLDRR